MAAEFRILWIDDIVPERRLGAGYPRAQSLLRLLASSGFQVTLFPYKGGRADRAAVADLNRSGVQVIQYGGRPRDVLAEFCEAELRQVDAIWISRPRNFLETFPIVGARRTGQPIIYDAEALITFREIARRDVAGRPLDRADRSSLLEQELSMMRRADAIVSVSVPEREVIVKACAKPTFLLGHPETASATSKGFAERSDLLFVGSFYRSNCANTDSMVYFAKEVLPLIRRQVACKLDVFGFQSEILRAEAFLHDDPAVVIHGFVDNLRDVYDNARVMVVPTRYAAGVPGKLAEAFAYGLPCVVTPIIAEQVPFHEPAVLSGSNPMEFASQVVSLYTDQALWSRMRQIGQEYAKAYCDENAIKAQINQLRSWIGDWHARTRTHSASE